MNSINHLIILSLSMFLFFACAHNHKHENHNAHDEHGHTDEHDHGAETHEEGGIYLTKDQIETMNITFGEFSELKINDYVRATGTLGLPPNAYSSVSAKASGFIKNSNKFVEGNYVVKGELMAYLENPEFISYQQEYLEISAEMTWLKQELNRQQNLVKAQAGVEKTVQKLQAEVDSKNATLKGIEKRLNYLGIGVSTLTPDNIVERIAIISPMSGYLTTIKMHNGMYVTPQMELMEIVNEKHLHLELDVFEKDIFGLEEGQKISYTVPAMGTTVYLGEVYVIGKEFNNENKTVRIHGHLEKARPRFIKDLFIEAKIWLTDHTVQALPEKAIIKEGLSSYIYVANSQEQDKEVKFEQVMVLPGTTDNGFTSIKLIDPIPKGMQIVTLGAYYIYAQSKAGELKHEH